LAIDKSRKRRTLASAAATRTIGQSSCGGGELLQLPRDAASALTFPRAEQPDLRVIADGRSVIIRHCCSDTPAEA
jgi:hypothetical protein